MSAQAALSGRVALITGASRGIGAAVAKRFATEGAHVILIARTVGGLEEVDDAIRAVGGQATLVPCDLTDFEAIDTLGPALIERFGKLDIFVGNAGVLGEMTPLTHYDAKSWHEVFDVNVHANWRLIRTLDPLLRRSESGRAIIVTSGAAASPRAFWGAYAVTKAAVESLAKVWASELENSEVRVNLLNPGATRTGMRAAAFPGEDPESLKTPEEVVGQFVEMASPAWTSHGELIDLA
ncbi:MAG: SDR family NAD(P)-dependent oxidoreductase [Alphaproteobacteria bacterium]|jgi:NAD(P)-dependent dehydrogenase (short-subunit alcohol dehydrogenase family)|nr:SDR family NAD(P)-dependent oxidoreductase [Alphaproteobacteria bacterium]